MKWFSQVLCDSKGNAFVKTIFNRILVFDPEGQLLTTFKRAKENDQWGLCLSIASNDVIYISRQIEGSWSGKMQIIAMTFDRRALRPDLEATPFALGSLVLKRRARIAS